MPSPAYVQSAASVAFAIGTSASVTYGSNVTKGNLLICASQTDLVTDATTISDTQGNVWTHLINQPGTSTSGSEGDLWYAIAKTSGSDTVTVSTATAAYIGAAIAEYSGVNVVDGAEGNQSSATSQSFSTSVAAEVLISFFSASTGGVTTMGGGFTLRQSISVGGTTYFVFGDYIVSSKSTYAATCNATNPSWSVIAGFYEKKRGAGLLLGVG